MAKNLCIETKNLSKKYPTTIAVDNINLKIYAGEIFGILGPNGAGKTTLLEMLEGLRKPSKGAIFINNKKIDTNSKWKNIKEIIGVQLQASSYFDYLTLKEILDLLGSFYKKSRDSEKLLKKIQLFEKRDSFVNKLSGGQQQRFSIVASLINDPDILFLDEPTTGLDPKNRRIIWDFIREINANGKTIILTTHYMQEAEELCDRVAIMNKSKIVALDSPIQLIQKYELEFKIKFITKTEIDKKVKNSIAKSKLVQNFYKEKQKYVITVKKAHNINDVLNLLETLNITFFNLEIIPPNLEDVFLKITGRSLRNNNHD